MKIISEIDEF